MGTLAFAMEILKLLPSVIAGVKGAADAMTQGRSQIEAMVAEKRDPTEAEWAALHARTAALRSALHSDDVG